jgi:glutaminyl-tRNA synthetase
VDIALLEYSVREYLNQRAPRVMAVLRPLKVVIENYPRSETEVLEAVNNPEDAAMGTRQVTFSREIYIEQDDFLEDPPKKYFRLAPGREVRLRYAFFVICREAVKDPASGEIVELRCTYDPATKGGNAPDGRKVKATLHWVSARDAVEAQVRLYDRLFDQPDPESGEDGKTFKDHINPDSVEVLTGCKLEAGLAQASAGDFFQFERLGYFCVDAKASAPGQLVFNRTVSLKDPWAKLAKTARK